MFYILKAMDLNYRTDDIFQIINVCEIKRFLFLRRVFTLECNVLLLYNSHQNHFQDVNERIIPTYVRLRKLDTTFVGVRNLLKLYHCNNNNNNTKEPKYKQKIFCLATSSLQPVVPAY